ncbi:hypothetical protein [Gimesia aquarii]|uniref:Uncharacterized protein n=1 Tax=Gimesia aquarii TaxID=2527964 RepID=A0A517WZ57_9PLAN|nr:hypothetical protein [Gimesia aquarii]QDU10534.1 hypothetical protein V202x_39460 [Gimesia aquarii]
MNQKRLIDLSISVCCLVCFPLTPGRAQEVRIQQPIVQQFSTGTTVSVPDRGRALLGGISSGATRSKRFGPFRRGSSYGQEFQSSTSSVGVYIHDFEAMDRFLLKSATSTASRIEPPFQTNHSYWKQQLLSQHFQTAKSKNFSGSFGKSQRSSLHLNQITRSKAERFFELGQKAERKYATSNVAKLHYRMAAKYGSVKAKERLTKLNAHQAKGE